MAKTSLKLELKDYEIILKFFEEVEPKNNPIIQKLRKKIADLKKPKQKRIVEMVKYKCLECNKEFKRAVFKCKECDNTDIEQIRISEFM